MEERITTRLKELRAAEQETIAQLRTIRTVIAELKALLSPEPDDEMVRSGDGLGEQQP